MRIVSRMQYEKQSNSLTVIQHYIIHYIIHYRIIRTVNRTDSNDSTSNAHGNDKVIEMALGTRCLNLLSS